MPSYPEYRHANSIDSDRTASDATIDDKDPSQPYRDNDDAPSSGYPPTPYHGDGHQKLDLDQEEEVVGLMQMDRDGHTSIQPKKKRALLSARLSKGGRGGCLVFVGVLLGFALGLAVLQWLSSASSSDTFSVSAANSTKSSAASKVDKIKKLPASTNDAVGSWGLAHATGIQVDFQQPGWETISQAANGTGLTETQVKSFKTHDGKDLMQLDMDDVFGGTLRAQESDLTWCEEDPDQGVFTHVDWAMRDIYVEDVTHARRAKTGEGTVAPFGGKVLFVEGRNVKDENGRQLSWTSFKMSPDMRYVLFYSNEEKQWRYSQHANVWVYSVLEKNTIAIGEGPSYPPTISYAAWAPKRQGSHPDQPTGLAYVQGNNLYYIPKPGDLAIKITNDGDKTIFNAVPDWAYEEEIFGGDSTLWFSPGGTKLAYLRLDETKVPIYEFPIYNPDKYVAGKTTPYLDTVKMKYPKPGFPNPLVSVHMVDLSEIHDAAAKDAAIRSTRYLLKSPNGVTLAQTDKAAHDVDIILADGEEEKERLVTEVTWLNDDELLIRETDRASDVMRLVLFDFGRERKGTPPIGNSNEGLGAYDYQLEGRVVRRQDARQDRSGWIRAAQTIEPLSHHNLSLKASAYLDIVVSPLGFRHLAFFPDSASDKPIFLTQGKWEIDTLDHVDVKRNKAFFTAARPTPSHRHLFSVDLPEWHSFSTYTPSQPTALTDSTQPGFYTCNFDPKGAYYVLNYQGPDVPYQKVVGVDNPKWEMMLESNDLLRQISSQYVRPQSVFYNMTLEGVPVSVKEIRPHDFDPSGVTKYPVLVRVYGGPDSQLVNSKWDRADWHQYVASTLRYIVCVIDGRGTGFRGQAYRASVTRNLGHNEASDVTSAAILLSSLPYVDSLRIGVWGWSYGGYLTSKILQLDTHLFSLGISVAPVTKWEFYDSIYTERYMKLTHSNTKGYFTSAVHVNRGFKNFLLMQGSADDNVHFSNSAHLLDELTKAKVRGWRFRLFTDSDHSIGTRGAYRELYEEMTAYLKEMWGGGARGI